MGKKYQRVVLVKILSSSILIMAVTFLILPIIALFMHGHNLNAWVEVLSNYKTYEAMGMTVLIAVLSLIINVVIGTPTAGILVRHAFKGKKFVIALLMLPFIIPGFATSMGIYLGFIKLNLVETLLGVTLIHSIYTLPYYILIMMVGYQTFAEEYNHMGWIFGASNIQNFYYITLPQLLPSILVGSCLVLTISFTQYLNTFIIGGGEIITIPILMFPYLSSGNLRIGSVFAILFIVMNVLLVFLTELLVHHLSKKKTRGI